MNGLLDFIKGLLGPADKQDRHGQPVKAVPLASGLVRYQPPPQAVTSYRPPVAGAVVRREAMPVRVSPEPLRPAPPVHRVMVPPARQAPPLMPKAMQPPPLQPPPLPVPKPRRRRKVVIEEEFFYEEDG